MSPQREVHPVEIAGKRRELPLFEVAPGVRIAIINILGDTELVEAVADEMASRMREGAIEADVLVTAEAKSIPLAHALSVRTELPYVVLRKTYKPYMGDAIESETLSITTGKPQHLYLDEKDRSLLQDARVLLLDDVISTGSTLKGMEEIVEKAGGRVVARMAIFTEGDDPARWSDVMALGHLPIFRS